MEKTLHAFGLPCPRYVVTGVRYKYTVVHDAVACNMSAVTRTLCLLAEPGV